MSVCRSLARHVSNACVCVVSVSHHAQSVQSKPLGRVLCDVSSRLLSHSTDGSRPSPLSSKFPTVHNDQRRGDFDVGKSDTHISSVASNSQSQVFPSPPETNASPDHKDVEVRRFHYDRRFVTVVRAMEEFLLKKSDLESLGFTKRRSPFENEPPILVYRLSDVRTKALEKWGSLEKLSDEKSRRESWMLHQETLFSVKKMLKDYRRSQRKEQYHEKVVQNLKETTHVVYTAVAVNAINAVAKGAAFLLTGSSSLFSETLHSMADTVNQLILALGIHKSSQRANVDHPYGYSNVRYVASLISGVGIFCLGSGVAFFHGFHALYDPAPLTDFFVAYCVLAGALVSEGVTLAAAVRNIRRNCGVQGCSFWSYVRRGSDPSVNVVLLEDLAAVIGVFIAGTSMATSAYTGNMIFDAIGSMSIGVLLGSVASFIIYSNAHALVGKSISPDDLERINQKLENDVMVRGVHDVKGIDMGNGLVRYKAEVDFDGRELTKKYLERVDYEVLTKQIAELSSNRASIDLFLLKHGEAIVDMMGAEIDRIESDIKKNFPQIRHIDLEIL